MEKITIKQLMNRYRFKDIAKELATVWEHNPIGTDYRDYKILYRRLQQTEGGTPGTRSMSPPDGMRSGKRDGA